MNREPTKNDYWEIRINQWWELIKKEVWDKIRATIEDNFWVENFDISDNINTFIIKIETLQTNLESITLKSKEELDRLWHLIDQINIYITTKKDEFLRFKEFSSYSLISIKINYLRIRDIIKEFRENNKVQTQISNSCNLWTQEIDSIFYDLNKKFISGFPYLSEETPEFNNLLNTIINFRNGTTLKNDTNFAKANELVREICTKIMRNDNNMLNDLDIWQIKDLKECLILLRDEVRNALSNSHFKPINSVRSISLNLMNNFLLKKSIEETNIQITTKEMPEITDEINSIFSHNFDSEKLATNTWEYWKFINDFRKVTKFIIINRDYFNNINKETLDKFILALEIAYYKLSEIESQTKIPSISFNTEHSMKLITGLNLFDLK